MPKPLPDAGQAGVVGQLLVQGVAEVPAMGQVEAGRLDELALGADALEEHHQLQLEEDDRVDAGPAALGIELPRPVADEAQVELRLQVAVEVVSRERGPPARRRSARRGGGVWRDRAWVRSSRLTRASPACGNVCRMRAEGRDTRGIRPGLVSMQAGTERRV